MSDHPALPAARRFIEAVLWGEHLMVWELLSEVGRSHVLEAGSRRGLDAVKASRIRQGTSSADEIDTFLTGVLQGLRVDFSAVDLASVNVGATPEVVTPDVVRFELEAPASFGAQPWAAGSLVLSRGAGGWVIDRVEPLVSRS